MSYTGPEHPLLSPVTTEQVEQAKRSLPGGRIFRAFARLAFGKGIVESTNSTLATHAALAAQERTAITAGEKAVQPYFTAGIPPAAPSVIGGRTAEQASVAPAQTTTDAAVFSTYKLT